MEVHFFDNTNTITILVNSNFGVDSWYRILSKLFVQKEHLISYISVTIFSVQLEISVETNKIGE